MPRGGFSGSLRSPKVDVFIDMGDPFLNRTVDGFLKIGAVGACKVAAEETFDCLHRGSVSKHRIEHVLKKMCKEGAYWGTVAGVYVGMVYGAERVRGRSDWQSLASSSIMMASLSTLFLGAGFLLAAAVCLHSYGADVSNGGNASTTTTHLHFYMHDDYSSLRPTAMRVVAGRSLLVPSPPSDDDNATGGAPPSPREFGDIVVLNNALTEGPRSESALVGTVQGFGVRVSEGGVVSHVTMHLVMDAGEHRGSSVTVSCRIDVNEKVRESVVVGGTGRFRFARGYLLSRNYDYDLARGGVVEFDVYLQH